MRKNTKEIPTLFGRAGISEAYLHSLFRTKSASCIARLASAIVIAISGLDDCLGQGFLCGLYTFDACLPCSD